MAGDQAAAKDETTEPTIARVVRVVTQPGGRDIDWKGSVRRASLSLRSP